MNGGAQKAGVGVTFHSSSSSSSDVAAGNVDEIVRRLPDGSGMRELQDWLKSLRLHKYTLLLLEFTYEELLGLSEADLERKRVTTGAREEAAALIPFTAQVFRSWFRPRFRHSIRSLPEKNRLFRMSVGLVSVTDIRTTGGRY